jgi:chromosome segregation ATPase
VLEVREVRQGESRISITDMDDALIARLVQSGVPAATLEGALRPVIAKRAELGALERKLGSLEQDRNAIVQDQQRLRENMKALRGSSEEKQLLQRYTRQLDEQENRLEALQKQTTQTSADVERARAELGSLIAAVSFDVTAAPPPR